MKALKFFAKILLLLLIVVCVFGVYDHYQNKQAYEVKRKILDVLSSDLEDQKTIELENIGGVEWEQVCFISYELNGYDSAHGLDIPIKYLKIPENAFSQIADET